MYYHNHILRAQSIAIPEFVYTVNVGAFETISLPMFNADDSLYDFTVNFGDGSGDKSVTAYGDADREHEYVDAGNYDIRIKGLFDYIKFADSPDSIIELKSFGLGPAKLGVDSFANCSNFTTISATDTPGFHSDSLDGCFESCIVLATVNASINDWDVSTITNMTNMFFVASLFNQDISNWNVSNVLTMASMFRSATVFDQDIGSWNVSAVTNMSSMFQGATVFDQDIGGWTVSAVTLMAGMFNAAAAFNQNLNSWNVGIVTTMATMFQNATLFNGNIADWNVENVTLMNSMFQSSAFNQDIGGWDVGMVSNFTSMFRLAASFDQDISLWNITSATNITSMFRQSFAFNQDISSWDTSAITSFTNMFFSATSFDQDLGSWVITSLTSAVSMFESITLSTANYDALLIAWEAQVENTSVSFHGGDATYTQTSVDSGTTDGTTTGKLVDSTQNFLTTVSVGDIVNNTTDGTFSKVTNVDSDTVLSINNDNIPTGKDYVIQSSAASKARFELTDTSLWTIVDGGGA